MHIRKTEAAEITNKSRIVEAAETGKTADNEQTTKTTENVLESGNDDLAETHIVGGWICSESPVITDDILSGYLDR